MYGIMAVHEGHAYIGMVEGLPREISEVIHHTTGCIGWSPMVTSGQSRGAFRLQRLCLLSAGQQRVKHAAYHIVVHHRN